MGHLSAGPPCELSSAGTCAGCTEQDAPGSCWSSARTDASNERAPSSSPRPPQAASSSSRAPVAEGSGSAQRLWAVHPRAARRAAQLSFPGRHECASQGACTRPALPAESAAAIAEPGSRGFRKDRIEA
jgi:hypothetical protein